MNGQDRPRGGTTAGLVQNFDWSRTSLGPMSHWPQSLRTTVDIVLHSPIAMVLMWGPDHVMIYNDAYSAVAGARHPQTLGGTVPGIWPEIWDWNRAILEAGFRGEVLTYGDHHLVVERNGPDGLRILESSARVDLLITDVGLPGGMNGRQLADAARTPARPEGIVHNRVCGNGGSTGWLHFARHAGHDQAVYA